MNENNYFFDKNQTRYQFVKSNPGKIIYNWLFLPGGPGIDSNYLLQLINELDTEGNYWLIDFPNNGSNVVTEYDRENIFEKWGDCLLSAVRKFSNPILVGHSFGGYFPLFFPELEYILKGFIILNSVPTLHSDEFEKCVRENSLPSTVEARTAFKNNPTLEAAMEVYLVSAPYCFPASSLEKGIAQIKELTVNHCTVYDWNTKGSEVYSTIKWIPQNVPTLILGASHDFLTPISIFEQSEYFHRKNVQLYTINDAGHFPWIEKNLIIKNYFKSLTEKIVENV